MRRDPSDGSTLAAVGVAAIGVACCAGLPAIAAVLGGLTIAALVGIAGAILATASVIAAMLLVLRARRRRSRRAPINTAAS